MSADFHSLIELAARLCAAPTAFVVEAGRYGAEAIGASRGLAPEEREAAEALCRAVAAGRELVVVPAPDQDERLRDNALVRGGIRFVALAPLVPLDGFLAVLDRRARTLCTEETESLRALVALSAAFQREAALLAVNNAIVSSLTRDALMEATSEALRRIVPFDRAALTIHDPKTQGLRVAALRGPLPPQQYGVGVVVNLEDSHVGWAFRQQRTLLRQDLGTERRFTPEHRLYDEGIRSMCTAPLIVSGRCLGTITVGSLTPGRYTAREEAILGEVAKQVALAVSNMEAYEEIAGLKARLQAENQYLKEEIRSEHNHADLIGESPAWRRVLAAVDQVAVTDSTVLVTGETGTGKELVARALHERSPRRDRPLVKVNCGAISAGLVESELFGHVKGAFTGALAHREGRFALADGGTLFLDEVGELPLETQVKLLRVLQEQEFEPLGSSKTVRVDVRVVAATNRDLAAAVAGGKFRQDLYYRLNVVPLQVPALRERPGDVRLLAAFFVEKLARKLGKPARTISAETMERLAAYSWPGNVRELENVIERAVVLARGEALELPEDFSRISLSVAVAAPDLEPGASLEDVERRHIEAVLRERQWVIEGERGAAKALGLHPNTLRSRMQKLGLRRPR